ncbi:MAG: hypothetical protein ACSLE4_11210, partial [Methyloceanibacter sp.]|uniref:hypothetical protein n=1 Tax=Methyloceanibacter sp. TaxID=1965321 RepID=UPI003EE408D2
PVHNTEYPSQVPPVLLAAEHSRGGEPSTTLNHHPIADKAIRREFDLLQEAHGMLNTSLQEICGRRARAACAL